MDTEYEQSRVERMKRGLYTPGEKNDHIRPPELTKQDFGAKDGWEDGDLKKQLEENDDIKLLDKPFGVIWQRTTATS